MGDVIYLPAKERPLTLEEELEELRAKVQRVEALRDWVGMSGAVYAAEMITIALEG